MILLKLLLILALLATLPGCVTLSAPVVTEVKIPVAVPCAAPVPEKPDFAVDALEIGAPIDEQMRALRAERAQRKGYEIELEAAVRTCQ